MTDLTLYIGNKNYSSWSLRPWLVLKKAELKFDEVLIQLDVAGYKDKLLALSDAGTVPVLMIGDKALPDSLAISEFAAQCVPNLWPKDPKQKARAIELTKRMHSGFENIRREAPMNLRRRTSSQMPKSCLEDAVKIDQIWTECLEQHDGPFLFDDWSIVDAFFTPVATRFASYDLPRSTKSDTYISELMSDPDFQDWEAQAFQEPWVLSHTDEINQG